ncbi:MAG: bile acid:sodium symporter family protein [Cyclobacteriaceae bacterium]|nr:bile acid:sodium symporter family protein [Cyclobacteriaceae bacterium]
MIYKLLLGIAILCLLVFVSIVIFDLDFHTGPFLTLFFVLLAVSFNGYDRFRRFSYTIWIFAAVTASMYFPDVFLKIGDFELKKLIVPLLQVIMFGMGSQMSVKDFTGVIKMPKGVLIGITAQYTIMPIVGFTIAKLFDFPAEIAAGVLLIGCAPSGLASNVMSYIARANLALAVTLAAIATLLSPLLTPLLMKVLAGQYIEIKFWSMMLDIINMMILPIVAGFIFNLFSKASVAARDRNWQLFSFLIIILIKNFIYMKTSGLTWSEVAGAFAWDMFWFYVLPLVVSIVLKKAFSNLDTWMDKVLSFVSMAGIALIITIITAAGRDSLLDVGLLLILASLVHNLAGYSLGYGAGKLFGMEERDCRTVAFEVGMQNGGLASGLALQMGKIATVGLAPAIFGPLMNITGSSLATYWRDKQPKEVALEAKIVKEVHSKKI